MNPLPQELLLGLQRNHIRVIAVSEPFPTDRPDRVCLSLDTDCGPVAIKMVQSRARWEVFENMIRLWKSTFGARRSPPGLPRPIAFLEQQSALVMERIAGVPMIERMESGLERMDEIARTLADLHASDAIPNRCRDAKRVVRSIQRKAADLAGTSVEYLFGQLTNRLAKHLPEVKKVGHQPGELVPSHGDFSPRNILVSPERIALIDWDRFTLADPARDLAYFGAWIWFGDLRLGRKPAWTLGDRLIDLYQVYRPISNVQERIRFYRAVGLARIAHSQVKIWRSVEWVTPLLAEATRLLE